LLDSFFSSFGLSRAVDSAVALRLLIKVILSDDLAANKVDVRHAAQLRQSYSRLMKEIESHLVFARYEVLYSDSLRHDKVTGLFVVCLCWRENTCVSSRRVGSIRCIDETSYEFDGAGISVRDSTYV
jgi:hypothetical protein